MQMKHPEKDQTSSKHCSVLCCWISRDSCIPSYSLKKHFGMQVSLYLCPFNQIVLASMNDSHKSYHMYLTEIFGYTIRICT